MIRLHITAEGQTEQAFVKHVLAPYLSPFEVYADARCVLTSKDKRSAKEYRGGLLSYEKAKRDIQDWIKEDNHIGCRFSTMFDLYALPKNFPGNEETIENQDPYDRVEHIETAFAQDISDSRFIPYIQLYEFEALILADPRQLDWEYFEHDRAIESLVSMVSGRNPELINDSPQTAPSKRIIKEIPEYDKVTAGVAVAGRIGVETLQEKCRHFDNWLHRLERLSKDTQ